jgi:hypothetical protein
MLLMKMPGRAGVGFSRTIRRPPRHTTVSSGGRHEDPQPGSRREVPTTSPASFMSKPAAAVATRSTTYELGVAVPALVVGSIGAAAAPRPAFARPMASRAPTTLARLLVHTLMTAPSLRCLRRVTLSTRLSS